MFVRKEFQIFDILLTIFLDFTIHEDVYELSSGNLMSLIFLHLMA